MAALKMAIFIVIGVLVVGFVGLVIFYPLVKTVQGWLEGFKVWAFGKEAPVEVGLTIADGGEEAKEKKEE
jgi:hypothetical protein